jgi:cytochrome P450 PksS
MMHPNLSSREHKADPFPYWATLRDSSPVQEITLGDGRRAWIIATYDGVVEALKDKRLVKDQLNALTGEQQKGQPWMPKFARPLLRNMLDVDEPDHARLRGLVNKAFTPRFVEAMRGRIETLADELLDNVQGRDRFDLIREYALPIPTIVIAGMLGVPVEDRHRFSRWSGAIVSADTSKWAMMRALPNLWRFLRYIRRLVELRRTRPGDDLVSALVQAQIDDVRLNDDELVAMIFLLLVAGHETTVNLIGNGVLALLEHPDQLQRLRDEPALIGSAVEELLRFSPPLELATERYASEDLQIAGVAIPQGALVLCGLLSANRDHRVFEHADRLDLGRTPNRHLSFGLGAHYCLGAPLARLEGEIALLALLRRVPKLALAVDRLALRWKRGLVLRGLHELPVAVTLP